MRRHKRDERADACQEYYDALITALRRDIDLIPCPWRDTAPDAHSLAAEIKKVTEAIIGYVREREADPNPTKMPCGRLAWSFYLTHEDIGPYIDLSVMPMVKVEAKASDAT